MRTYNDRAEHLGGPRLVDSFLVYMDALGTESALKGPPAAVEARFQSFRKAWAEAGGLAGLDDPSWVATSVFSDLVVAALPILEDGEVEWASSISTAISFQFWLAIEGIFVRGALVRGAAWLDDTIVYGPALAHAHQLEQRTAVYPRIVIAENVQERLKIYAGYYGDRVANAPFNEQLLVDGAGVVFIDYLQGAFVSPIPEQQIDVLSQHREAVVSGLFDTRFEPRAQDKMYWSARYHNYFVSMHFPSEPGLLLEARDPQLDFQRLQDIWNP